MATTAQQLVLPIVGLDIGAISSGMSRPDIGLSLTTVNFFQDGSVILLCCGSGLDE